MTPQNFNSAEHDFTPNILSSSFLFSLTGRYSEQIC